MQLCNHSASICCCCISWGGFPCWLAVFPVAGALPAPVSLLHLQCLALRLHGLAPCMVVQRFCLCVFVWWPAASGRMLKCINLNCDKQRFTFWLFCFQNKWYLVASRFLLMFKSERIQCRPVFKMIVWQCLATVPKVIPEMYSLLSLPYVYNLCRVGFCRLLSNTAIDDQYQLSVSHCCPLLMSCSNKTIWETHDNLFVNMHKSKCFAFEKAFAAFICPILTKLYKIVGRLNLYCVLFAQDFTHI